MKPLSVDALIVKRDALMAELRALPEQIRAMEKRIAEAAFPYARMTAREKQVIDLVQKGLPNKAIASDLQISERTVKYHVSNLLAKFHVQNRRELGG